VQSNARAVSGPPGLKGKKGRIGEHVEGRFFFVPRWVGGGENTFPIRAKGGGGEI